eukprot:6428835-Amphidinium_carterae.1
MICTDLGKAQLAAVVNGIECFDCVNFESRLIILLNDLPILNEPYYSDTLVVPEGCCEAPQTCLQPLPGPLYLYMGAETGNMMTHLEEHPS